MEAQKLCGMTWFPVSINMDFVPSPYLIFYAEGRGFVHYPADSPHVSVVSAVHQLHCLVSP